MRRQEERVRIVFDGREYVLETEQWVPRPLDEVFSFFSDAKNLERITPPLLQFNILGMNTPVIQEGTLIDYRLKVRGIPMRWRTRIESWIPGKQFVDTQVTGPYALWHHLHVFEEKDGGTLMRDRVRFRLPLGILGRIFAGALVRRDVAGIFNYRMRVISELFK